MIGIARWAPVALACFGASAFAQDAVVDRADFFQDMQAYLSRTPAAADELRRLAAAGDAIAMARFCAAATAGRLRPRAMPEEGAPYCRKLAEQGLAGGMMLYGIILLEGNGVAKDSAEGLRWMRAGAEKGNVIAMVLMGDLYSDGKHTAQDQAEAAKWQRMAAEKGNTRAAFLVGSRYLIGRGVGKDDAEAAKWLLAAAQGGHVLSMIVTGTSLANGRGVARNEGEAVRWLRLAVEKHAPGALLLPMPGADPANKEAPVARYYQGMAAGGDHWGMFVVGVAHENGLLGLAKDSSQALDWYRKAAGRGNELAIERVKSLDR
jgi:uncharacterized protein